MGSESNCMVGSQERLLWGVVLKLKPEWQEKVGHVIKSWEKAFQAEGIASAEPLKLEWLGIFKKQKKAGVAGAHWTRGSVTAALFHWSSHDGHTASGIFWYTYLLMFV